MTYRVTADRDDANSADIEYHESMVETILDMVGLGSEPPDTGGPIGWVLEYADPAERPSPLTT